MNRRSHRLRSPRSFTLVEVMVAATVMVFGIVSAVTVSQRGLQALDTARNLAVASQLMQNEMERVRLMSWTQLVCARSPT
ncbi:MAG: prepilin-type N-terminal cleavage/methylation domain-containing protein [Opitutae bacterium]|nr:prepilin-type N-terminal cleavage/methylation domain-containing protein [Opitutae bacterium]